MRSTRLVLSGARWLSRAVLDALRCGEFRSVRYHGWYLVRAIRTAPLHGKQHPAVEPAHASRSAMTAERPGTTALHGKRRFRSTAARLPGMVPAQLNVVTLGVKDLSRMRDF